MRTWRSPAAAAISHARRGWTVVPVNPATGIPAWKWRNLTSTPPGLIAASWPGPRYNPAVVTGPSGLVVVDLDDFAAHSTELPPEWAGTGVTHGAEVLAVLAERAGQEVPATYTVTTARNGRHLYFQALPDHPVRNSAGRDRRGIGPGVDVRGIGGLAAAAGTVRPHGTYGLADDRDPGPLPRWLAELAAPSPAPRREPARQAPAIPGRGYAAAAMRAEVAILMSATRGHRNDQLNRSAFALGQLVGSGDLAEADVTAALMNAAEAIGLAADDDVGQCERTIASGLTAGITRPRNRRAA